MLLSLEIMLPVEVFVLLGTGTASAAPLLQGSVGSTGTWEHGRDAGWIAQEPVRSHALLREPAGIGETGQCNPWPPDAARRPVERTRTRNNDRHAESAGEFISARMPIMGSRSASVVPMMLGNFALEDPTEERGAPVWQNRCWETRRTP